MGFWKAKKCKGSRSWGRPLLWPHNMTTADSWVMQSPESWQGFSNGTLQQGVSNCEFLSCGTRGPVVNQRGALDSARRQSCDNQSQCELQSDGNSWLWDLFGSIWPWWWHITFFDTDLEALDKILTLSFFCILRFML